MYNSAALIDDKGEGIGNMRKVNKWSVEKDNFREEESFLSMPHLLEKLESRSAMM